MATGYASQATAGCFPSGTALVGKAGIEPAPCLAHCGFTVRADLTNIRLLPVTLWLAVLTLCRSFRAIVDAEFLEEVAPAGGPGLLPHGGQVDGLNEASLAQENRSG